MSEPAIERLRTAVSNMNDIEAQLAPRVARARGEFAAAMGDPAVRALLPRERGPLS